jgi:SlyX protein
MSANVESRLVKLEILAAEQEHTIAEMSAELTKAWKVIDEVTRRMEALQLRMTGIEEATAPDTPITKPPHW